MPDGSYRFTGTIMASKKLSKLKRVAREYNRHPAGASGSRGGQFAPKNRSGALSIDAMSGPDVIPPGKAKFVVRNGEIILSSGKRVVPNKKLKDGTIILGKEELKALKKEILDPLPESKPKETKARTQSSKEETENTAPKQNQKNKLPINHLITANPRYDADSLDAALDSLTNNGAQERVRKFREFVRIHEIQSVFNDESASPTVNLAAVKNGLVNREWARESFVGDKILKECTGRYKEENGYTSENFNHVVVHTLSERYEYEMFDVDSKILNSIVKDYIKASATPNTKVSGMSHGFNSQFKRTGDISYADIGNFLTYIHEVGHQVHIKAGIPRVPFLLRVPEWKEPYAKPSFTKRGNINELEWFAESFVAWVIDPDTFAAHDPGGAKFIEQTMDIALKTTSKRNK